MFKNINLSLLSLISFKTNGENHKVIFFDKTDLPNLSIGLVRMLKKPSITLFEINSIFAWFVHPDFQLMKRTKTQGYSDLKRSFIRSLQTVDYTQVTANTNIFHAIDFIKNVSLEGEKDTLNSMAIEQILKGFKQDSNYWQLAIRTSSFLDEMHVMKLIGKDWFKDFHNEIRRRIDQLGTELYGKAYPYFKELNHHKALARSTNDNSLESIQRQQRSYYLQRTNFEWYPTYVKVKQQMGVLKSCPPLWLPYL
jgi:hypothetical protein